ncbi:MAG: DUF4199 domain-containing protein [Muribaculaceae bacterium]|nr:DUF4199 domain-containing protein [Muribaculaceae bacterium]
MRQEPKPKTIYARGADDGLWMGLYITAVMALICGSMALPLLQIPAFALALGVPFLTYFFLRRTHVAAHGMTVFSALWMQGIVMFACASLIFGAVAFVYLRYVNPGFIESVFAYLIDFYGQADSEGAQALADELRMVADGNAYPRPAVLVLGEMWSIMFSGSLLSMVVGAVARIRRVPVSR